LDVVELAELAGWGKEFWKALEKSKKWKENA
jgi:hypothetical protein